MLATLTRASRTSAFRTYAPRTPVLCTPTLRPRVAAPAGRRFLSTEDTDDIKSAIEVEPVVLFMKGTPEFPACGFSKGMIQMLGAVGVNPEKFAAYNVLTDDKLRQGLKEYLQWPTFPQLYVEQEFVGGFDIVKAMYELDELEPFLKEKGLLVDFENEAAEAAEVEAQADNTNVKPRLRE